MPGSSVGQQGSGFVADDGYEGAITEVERPWPVERYVYGGDDPVDSGSIPGNSLAALLASKQRAGIDVGKLTQGMALPSLWCDQRRTLLPDSGVR